MAPHIQGLQIGEAFISGGGLVALGNWILGFRRKAREHRRLTEFLTGAPAAPGVPAVPSLVERLDAIIDALEKLTDRVALLGGRIDKIDAQVGTIERDQGTTLAGQEKWTEGFERRLRSALARIRKIESHPAVGITP